MYFLSNPLLKSLTENKSTYISANFDVEKSVLWGTSSSYGCGLDDTIVERNSSFKATVATLQKISVASAAGISYIRTRDTENMCYLSPQLALVRPWFTD